MPQIIHFLQDYTKIYMFAMMDEQFTVIDLPKENSGVSFNK